MTHQLKFDHQLGLPFSELWLLNPSSRSSNERSGKCKRCLKFSRNDQIIAKSGYSAARPIFCVPNFTVPVSSSGSTSLLAGVDAILMANNIYLDPDFLFFDGLLFPGLGRARFFLSRPSNFQVRLSCEFSRLSRKKKKRVCSRAIILSAYSFQTSCKRNYLLLQGLYAIQCRQTVNHDIRYKDSPSFGGKPEERRGPFPFEGMSCPANTFGNRGIVEFFGNMVFFMASS